MKPFKLALVPLVIVFLCLFYINSADLGRFPTIDLLARPIQRSSLVVDRCLRYAPHLSSCYQDEEFDFTADFYGMIYEGNTKNLLDRHIFYYGAFEKHMLFFMRDVMQSVYSGKGVFLDIGANTGQYSLFMSRHAEAIHAFEPYEPVLRRFRRLLELNHAKNIFVHPFGLGLVNEKKTFYKPPDNNLGIGSFVVDWGVGSTEELEIQIGDDALEKAGVKSVALIKMDIESFEKPALQGLQRTLNLSRPIIKFEMTIDPYNPLTIKSNDDLRSLFPQEYGFLVFDQERSNPFTGYYHLIDVDEQLRFDTPAMQYEIVAYPIEKKDMLPRSGPS